MGHGDQLRTDGAVIAFGGGDVEFIPCVLQKLALGHQIGGSAGQYLGSVQQTLVGDGGFTAGNILPAVTGAAIGEGDRCELGGGCQPADLCDPICLYLF